MEPLVEYVGNVWMCGRRPSKTNPAASRMYWLSCGKRAQTCNSSSSARRTRQRMSCSSRRSGVTGKSLQPHRWVLTLRIPSIPFENLGSDRPGVAAEVTQKLAEGGINLRGFSLSGDRQTVSRLRGGSSLDDANKVIEILKA